MTSRLLQALIVVIAILAGWWLAGGIAGPAATTNDSPISSRVSPPQTIASSGLPISATRPWSGPMIPLEDFEGVHEIREGSPALNVEHCWQDVPQGSQLLFANWNSFDLLADWLELTSSERGKLSEILRQAADRQLAWEKANLKAVRQEPGRQQIRWRESGPEIPAALRNDLREAFSETLARSIWIRGGLERFFEPVPGWKRRGIEEIDLQLTPAVSDASITARITNGDFTPTWRLSADDPEQNFPMRLRHLFEVKEDAAELVANLPQEPEPAGFPVAEWFRPGFVKSPFHGKVIDVSGIPAGTLVQDPSAPADAKAYFRVPEPD